MINIIVGKPGTGKTYSLVRLAYKQAKKGTHIYSNFHIDFSDFDQGKNLNQYLHFWTHLEDFLHIKQGIIMIDEAQIYFNSRGWKDLPLQIQYKFQQHRKQGLDIWGATQNLKRVDTVVREIVNTVYEVRRVGKLFIMKSFDVEDIDKANRKSYNTSMFLLNKALASCYDTYQEVENSFQSVKPFKPLKK